MYLHQLLPKKNVAFGKINQDYKSDEIKSRAAIRKTMEEQWGGAYSHANEIGYMSANEAKAFIAMQAPNDLQLKNSYFEDEPIEEEPIQKTFNVDVEALMARKKPPANVLSSNPLASYGTVPIIENFRERIPNRLYTGQSLAAKPEITKLLKTSGINSVLYLLNNNPYYRQNATDAGLNYMELKEIGNGTLSSSNFDIINELTKKPEMYADSGNKEIEDLKTYIDTLNGKNEDLPHPLYMGCSYAHEITPNWVNLYTILKDQPKDEPLSESTIAKLSDFLNMIEYGKPKRW